MKCISCKKDIIHLYADDDGCLDGACRVQIHGGYGSSHDLTEYTGFICDDCVTKANPFTNTITYEPFGRKDVEDA